MERRQSRTVWLTERLYQWITASTWFWLRLLQKAVVYGIVKGSYELFQYLQDDGMERLSYSRFQKNHPVPFKHSGWLSFLWTAALTTTFTSGYLLQIGNFSAGIQLVFIVALLSFCFLQVYISHFIVESYPRRYHAVNTRLLHALALNKTIRHPLKDLYCLSLTLIIMLTGIWNIILFLFLLPSAYMMLIGKVMGSTHEEEKHAFGK